MFGGQLLGVSASTAAGAQPQRGQPADSYSPKKAGKRRRAYLDLPMFAIDDNPLTSFISWLAAASVIELSANESEQKGGLRSDTDARQVGVPDCVSRHLLWLTVCRVCAH